MIYSLRFLLLSILFIFVAFTATFSEPAPTGKTSEFLRGEHNYIHAMLERLEQTPGKTGAAAKQLFIVSQPHMFREEKFVMPQLGVLRSLALGENTGDLSWVMPLSDELKKQFPQMQADHKAILKYADKLFRAAEIEGDQMAMTFVTHLRAHVQDEEDIVYPAAMLAGQYVRVKFQKKM